MSVIIVVMMTIVLIPGKNCSRGWGELRTAWLCLYASGFTANITLHPQFMTKVNLTNLTKLTKLNLTNLTILIKIMTKVNLTNLTTLNLTNLTTLNLTNLTILIKIMTKVNGQKLDLVEDSVVSLRIRECGVGCNQR